MTCRIYTPAEAVFEVKAVNELVALEPSYRVGQGLYNILPKEITEAARELPDHYIWYNSLDRQFCVKYFYDHFVKEN